MNKFRPTVGSLAHAIRSIPPATATVLWLCVGLRLAQVIVGHSPLRAVWLGNETQPYLLIPDLLSTLLAISGNGLALGFFWTPLTYIFLHGSLTHLLLNMAGLLAFGPSLERAWGKRAFWFIFLLSGALGGIGWALCNGLNSLQPCVGASAAVLGLAGAVATLAPKARFVMLFPFPAQFSARTLACALFVLNALELAFVTSNTAYLAHLFGIVGGAAAGLYLRRHPDLRLRP